MTQKRIAHILDAFGMTCLLIALAACAWAAV